MGEALRSLSFLAGHTLRRQVLSKKTAMAFLFLMLLGTLVVAVGMVRSWTPAVFGKVVVLGLFGTFFLPIVALAYGLGALGDDRDDRSLVYLRSRPLPRSGLFVAKLCAVVPPALVFSLGGLWLLSRLAGLSAAEDMGGAFAAFWPGILWSTLAYLSLCHFFSAAFRHSTVIAVAYIFFVEFFIGQMPGILKRISIQFYSRCMAFQSAEGLGIEPTGQDLQLYLPIDGSTAQAILIGLAAGLLIAGAAVFARREYRET